jgi:hypothetical protein
MNLKSKILLIIKDRRTDSISSHIHNLTFFFSYQTILKIFALLLVSPFCTFALGSNDCKSCKQTFHYDSLETIGDSFQKYFRNESPNVSKES